LGDTKRLSSFHAYLEGRLKMRVADENLVVEPQAGRVLSWKIAMPGGEVTAQMTLKITGDQTSGGFFVTETTVPPGGFVPPHRHEHADEVLYIQEGELGVMVGDKEFEVGAGSFSVRPRGLPHAIWNTGDRPARCFEIATPATFLAGFEELARRYSSTPATLEQLMETSRLYDTTWLPELAPRLVQKYNLKMGG
jgi:mannose-6-phosphate isomerase-like protein (cupin superfamily)